jgi:hypothetical protein
VDPDDDDIFLTPAARLCELAEILAAGILRLHVREALVADSDVDPAETLPEPGSARLEVPAETVLSVHTRVNGFREPRTRSEL